MLKGHIYKELIIWIWNGAGAYIPPMKPIVENCAHFKSFKEVLFQPFIPVYIHLMGTYEVTLQVKMVFKTGRRGVNTRHRVDFNLNSRPCKMFLNIFLSVTKTCKNKLVF